MKLVTTSEDTDGTDESQIQVSLGQSQVEELRETLPWLLRALADRPETPPRYRARRKKAHTLLQGLLDALPPQVALADGDLAPH
jgi:hypothetical protein